MKIFASILLWIAGITLGESSSPHKVYLHISNEIVLDSEISDNFKNAALELLETSNFNSVSHSDLLNINALNVHKAYRKTVSKNFMLVTFDSPMSINSIGGKLDVYEIIIGFGDEYADALFTVDSTGRVVKHEKYSGQYAIELQERVKIAVKDDSKK